MLTDVFRFLGELLRAASAGDIVRYVVDILLLSFILYIAVRFLWDRRAGKLAVGLLLIMGIMACSASR